MTISKRSRVPRHAFQVAGAGKARLASRWGGWRSDFAAKAARAIGVGTLRGEYFEKAQCVAGMDLLFSEILSGSGGEAPGVGQRRAL